ncbi:MAG: hypothetical protein R3D60_04340 [Paracoccaceae bacterium]
METLLLFDQIVAILPRLVNAFPALGLAPDFPARVPSDASQAVLALASGGI